jgi:hypothetical protein
LKRGGSRKDAALNIVRDVSVPILYVQGKGLLPDRYFEFGICQAERVRQDDTGKKKRVAPLAFGPMGYQVNRHGYIAT